MRLRRRDHPFDFGWALTLGAHDLGHDFGHRFDDDDLRKR
jgi:hypothetical protein